MFKMSINTMLFMGQLLFWICASGDRKSHYMWIDRVEPNVLSNEWVAQNFTIQIRKTSKNDKVMNISLTALSDITEDIMCTIKVYQKMGGKYLKSPFDFPSRSCCGFMKNKDFWSCVMRFSNLLKQCPLPKDTYEVKEFNANECDVRFMLPPHIPENYKVELKSFKDQTPIFTLIGYGTMKRKFPSF